MVRVGYKQTEVGEIPEDWDSKPLDNMATSISSGTSNTKPENGDYPLYGSTGRIGYKAYFDYEGEKILVARVGANAGTVNKVSGKYCVSDNTLIVNLSNDVNLAFFYFQLIRRNLNNLVFGSGQPLLTGGQLKELNLAVPRDKCEQTQIAKALSDVDELIASLEKLIAKKRDIKTATMQQLLTGKKRLPGFEGEWHTRNIDDLVDVDPENLNSSTNLEYEFKYISLEDVDKGVLSNYSDQIYKSSPSRARRILKRGDVLVSTVRPNLKSHLLFSFREDGWICSTGFSVLRAKKNKVVPEFIYYQFFGGSIEKQIETLIAGSNYPAINSADVRCLEIPTPEPEEQRAISKILIDIAFEITSLSTRLHKTKAIKQGMMQELLTGRTRLPLKESAA